MKCTVNDLRAALVRACEGTGLQVGDTVPLQVGTSMLVEGGQWPHEVILRSDGTAYTQCVHFTSGEVCGRLELDAADGPTAMAGQAVQQMADWDADLAYPDNEDEDDDCLTVPIEQRVSHCFGDCTGPRQD